MNEKLERRLDLFIVVHKVFKAAVSSLMFLQISVTPRFCRVDTDV